MRIRSIKPEFWASESMGRLARDERLVFIGLWSLADDHGRFRADPRFITGQLFPYDTDGVGMVSRALASLRECGSIALYEAEGSKYGVVCHWKAHQKIDRPSASRLPQPPEIPLASIREPSPTPREPSCEEQGTGNREGSREQGEEAAPPPPHEFTVEAFFAKAQDHRSQLGAVRERPPHQRQLSAWWSRATGEVSGDVDRLWAGFLAYAADSHWRPKQAPWAGWISQWERFVPAAAPKSAQAGRRDAEAFDALRKMAARHGLDAYVVAQFAQLEWHHDDDGVLVGVATDRHFKGFVEENYLPALDGEQVRLESRERSAA